MIQSFIDAEVSRCRNRESMLYQKFFRDLGSDLVLFEKCKDLIPKLFLIFFEDIFVVDEIIFINEKHHPFFDNEIPLFIRVKGNKPIILSDLDFEIFVFSSEFGIRVCNDFFK